MASSRRMVTDVSRQVVPDRPHRRRPSRASPTARRSIATASDKPDLRFGTGAARPAARSSQGSDFGVFNAVLAAGGRGRRLSLRPGWRRRLAPPDRRADRRSPSAHGAQGPRPPLRAADDGITSPVRKFLGEARARRSSSASAAAPGDLVLHRRRRGHRAPGGARPGARRVARQLEPGQDKNELSYVWVYQLPDVQVGRRRQPLGRHAQPVQRRQPGGRGADDRVGDCRDRPEIRPAGRARCSTTSR